MKSFVVCRFNLPSGGYESVVHVIRHNVWFYVSKIEKKKVLYLKSPKVLLKKYISFIKIGT